MPLSRFFLKESSVTFDQIRHFLEVLPSLAVFASIAILFFWKKYSANFRVKLTLVFTCFTILFYNIWIVLLYRPYGTAYFNILAGPKSYVNHAFDVEYWGNVYREAAKYLNKKYGANVKYYTAGLGAHILREDGLKGELTDDYNEQFDYVIFMNKQTWLRGNKYAMWLLRNKKPIYTIEREGTILFYQFKPFKEEHRQSEG